MCVGAFGVGFIYEYMMLLSVNRVEASDALMENAIYRYYGIPV